MGITIWKIPLGRISVGSISIGRLGKKSAGSSQPRDLYKRILNSMPSALRESLVAWYSPNLQGLTNAELADSLNEYVDGLKDLSENGNHMTLKGFSGMGPSDDDEEGSNGGGYVNEDGNLCFDGWDDYATTNGNIPLGSEQSSTFLRLESAKDGAGFFVYGNNTFSLWKGNNAIASRVYNNGANTFAVSGDICASIDVFSDRRKIIINDVTNNLTRDYIIYINEPLVFGCRSLANYCKMTLKSFIRFDRGLSDTEIAWVKSNMLVSQSVKTNTITLYCGEFDEDGTLIDDSYDVFTFSVQHCNSLNDADGNLLSKYHKDIDSTHCTSDVWYDTDGLPYAGEAITEDCTFYCERQLIYEHMLEQLDGVTLTDGSTAKEHLVAMYYPKYQGLTKSDVLGGAKLQDLSSVGGDLELFGFTEDEECITSDGSLYFDGVDDYAVGNAVVLDLSKDETLIAKTKNAKGTFYSFSVDNTNRNTRIGSLAQFKGANVGVTTYNGFWYYIYNAVNKTITDFNNTYNPVYTAANDSGRLCLANLRPDHSFISDLELTCIVRFDAVLTTDELNEVKQILKL